MVSSRIPAAIDALVVAVQAALTAASRTEPVWDGPIVTGDYTDAIYIGYDADPEGGEELAVDAQQEWAGLGAQARNEESQISCAIVVLTGDGASSWKTARDKAFSLLDIVNSAIRGTPDKVALGLSPPSVAELWPGQYFQENSPNGYQARLLFSIRHKTRV